MTKLSVLPPLSEVLHAYWKSDRWTLLGVASVVLVSGVVNVAAPYLFSRMIDRLSQDGMVVPLTWGFMAYAMLIGIATALQHMVQYLSFMSAENLGFITGTRFFARMLKKTAAFFVEHNPAEIQNAGEKGQSALTALVEILLIAFIPGMTQIVLTLVTLGSSIDLQVVFIVIVYGIGAVAVTVLANRRVNSFLDRAIEAGQENARFVGNAMNAMETLRQFGSDRWMSRRFTEKAEDVRSNWRAYALRRIGYVALLGLMLSVQLSAIDRPCRLEVVADTHLGQGHSCISSLSPAARAPAPVPPACWPTTPGAHRSDGLVWRPTNTIQ